MKKIINKIIPKSLKRLLKDKIKDSEFSKGIFRSIYLKKALVFPSQVEIETTSLCNARCVHCEYSKLKRSHAHMELDLFKKIIDECHHFRKYCKNIVLQWMGEPLLDPTFFEKVKYANQKNSFFVSIYSNGSLLTPANCQKLIESGIDKIIFSADGATKESYESVRVGLSYEKVVEGIKSLANLKKKLNAKTPKIVVRMTMTPSNVGEINLFKKTWKGIADNCYIKNMHVWGGETIDKDLVEYSYQHTKEQHGQFIPCFYLWKTMVVAQDGRVALCCIDADIQEEVGNLNKETIYEVWHGQKLKRVREMHLSGNMAKIPICQKCNFRETKGYPWWWYN